MSKNYITPQMARSAKQAAHDARKQIWTECAKVSGYNLAISRIESELGMSYADIKSHAKKLNDELTSANDRVLELESRLETLGEENSQRVDILVETIHDAQDQLQRLDYYSAQANHVYLIAKKIVGDLETETQDLYASEIANDPIVRRWEEMRVRLRQQRKDRADEIIAMISSKPINEVAALLDHSELGNEYDRVADTIEFYRIFRKTAGIAADEIVTAIKAGEANPCQGEIPKETHDVVARGCQVWALDSDDRVVAKWAISPMGGAYLIMSKKKASRPKKSSSFMDAARNVADEVVAAIKAGKSNPCQGEIPEGTRRVIARGNLVLALDDGDRAVAKWAVTPMGGSYPIPA